MADRSAVGRPDVIETDASSSFVCDYVAGVNRVLALPPYLVVDNIGRNVEVWRFQPGEPEPAARARYDRTSYPGDPIASLLDVDIHAAFLHRDGRELLAINHYGRVRGFELPAASARLQPLWECQLLGDTERIVMAGDCCITSSPRGEFTDDLPRPGIFLFAPIAAARRPASGHAGRPACAQALADWGVIDALAVSPSADRLAVSAGQQLGIFSLTSSDAGLRLGECLWEAALSFACQWLHFDETGCLWTGGHHVSPAPAGDESEAGRGGRVDAYAADSGSRQFTAVLPDATTWGYGADPIVPAAHCRQLYVLGGDASLHVVDGATGRCRQLYEPSPPPDNAAAALGIGHATLLNGRIYAGFSRGGFRLWRYDLGPAQCGAGPRAAAGP